MQVLVFSPGNAIWDWAFPMALAAESLQKQGDKIHFLTCDREYSKFCMAQAASGAPFNSDASKKNEICDLCVAQRELICDKFPFNKLIINQFITEKDRQDARSLADSTTVENFRSCVVDGIPAGELAMYETIIQGKKHTLNFLPEEMDLYHEILFNVIKTIKGFNRVLDQVKPDVCFLEHTSYSYNRACELVAKSRKIPAYFAQGNTCTAAHCFEQLIIAKDDPLEWIYRVIRAWPKIESIPVSSWEASQVADHFISLMTARGRYKYSAGKQNQSWSIREHFKIKPHQKIILAATSSYDELFAIDTVGNFNCPTRPKAFADITEWIDALNDFMRTRPDLFMIIRVHPREFFKDHYGEISEHAKHLQAHLKNLPENVTVNWPTDKLSVYDLFEEVDVVLNAWSSVALEATFLGLPALTFCGDLLSYPQELIYSAHTKADYFQMLESALKDEWSFERIRKAFRWSAVLLCRVSTDISQSYPYNTLKKKNFFRKVFEKIMTIFDPFFRQKFQILSRAKTLKTAHQIRGIFANNYETLLDSPPPERPLRDEENEAKAIRLEMKRLYKAVYTDSETAPPPGKLQAKLWSFIQ